MSLRESDKADAAGHRTPVGYEEDTEEGGVVGPENHSAPVPVVGPGLGAQS